VDNGVKIAMEVLLAVETEAMKIVLVLVVVATTKPTVSIANVA